MQWKIIKTIVVTLLYILYFAYPYSRTYTDTLEFLLFTSPMMFAGFIVWWYAIEDIWISKH